MSQKKNYLKNNKITSILGQKTKDYIPYVFPVAYLHMNEFRNISEKNRYEKYTDLFLKLRTYLNQNPENELDIIKEFFIKHSIHDKNLLTYENITNFILFVKSDDCLKISPTKTLKEIISDACYFYPNYANKDNNNSYILENNEIFNEKDSEYAFSDNSYKDRIFNKNFFNSNIYINGNKEFLNNSIHDNLIYLRKANMQMFMKTVSINRNNSSNNKNNLNNTNYGNIINELNNDNSFIEKKNNNYCYPVITQSNYCSLNDTKNMKSTFSVFKTASSISNNNLNLSSNKMRKFLSRVDKNTSLNHSQNKIDLNSNPILHENNYKIEYQNPRAVIENLEPEITKIKGLSISKNKQLFKKKNYERDINNLKITKKKLSEEIPTSGQFPLKDIEQTKKKNKLLEYIILQRTKNRLKLENDKKVFELDINTNHNINNDLIDFIKGEKSQKYNFK